MAWTKNLLEPYHVSFPFLLSGVAVLLIDFALVGWARWDFLYAVPYSLALVGMAFIVAQERPDVVAGALSTLLVAVTVFTSMAVLNAMVSAALSVVLFALLLFSSAKWYFTFKADSGARYFAMASMLTLIVWVGAFLYGHLASLNSALAMYHGGVMLICLVGVARMLWSGKKLRTVALVGLVGVVMIVLGALWLTGGYGWGLQLAG
jgi:hypothetical protein